MAAQQNGSEQQLESTSSIFFSDPLETHYYRRKNHYQSAVFADDIDALAEKEQELEALV